MIVATAATAAKLLAPCFDVREGEILAVLHLDGERRLIESGFGDWGSEEARDLAIREILTAALRNGAASLVTAGNPPGTEADEAILAGIRRLADAAAAVDIRLADHLVFSGETCRSLRFMGLM